MANDFKIKLREWGFTCPIELTTTKVDDDLISNLTSQKVNSKINFVLGENRERKGDLYSFGYI